MFLFSLSVFLLEEGCGFTPDSLVKILTKAVIKLCFCTLALPGNLQLRCEPTSLGTFQEAPLGRWLAMRCWSSSLCTDWLFGLQFRIFRIVFGSNLTVSDKLDQFRTRTFTTSHWARGRNSYWSSHESNIKVSFWTHNSGLTSQ